MEPPSTDNRDLSPEDFEKVDKIPEQDEEVTTTSFSADKVEADRYEPRCSYSGNADTAEGNLLNLEDDAEQSSQSKLVSENLDQLLNLDHPKPSAPPATNFTDLMGGTYETNISSSEKESFKAKETKEETKLSSDEKKCQQSQIDLWLKNVDPRDNETQIEAVNEDIQRKCNKKNMIKQTGMLELIYWRDVKKTGVVFGAMLFVLLSLSCFSVLSVLAYLSLAVLTVTLSFRIYKNVLQAVQKSGEGHPFRHFLEMNIDLPEDKAKEAVVDILKHVNCTIRELRRLFLIEDLVDSIKFALLLWVLTYIGAWFNGMTLIIMAEIAIFTLPKVYETYKVQIDDYIAVAYGHVDKVWKQVQAKVPFLKKKEKKQ